MVSRRLAAILAMVVVTPLALAACGDDDKAKQAWVGGTPAASAAPSEVSPQESAPSI